MMVGQGIYNVDIVMCIDGTASMGKFIDQVKANALSFHDQLTTAMEATGKFLQGLRLKVIVFRDYGCDAEPMTESAFFTLPAENEEFQNYVNGIQVSGGGDLPENSLEAIAHALKSDWVTEGTKKRHIVVMFTDAPALELGERAESPNYPEDMPKNLAELGAWWQSTDQNFKSSYDRNSGRLVVYAPNAYPWTAEGVGLWNRTVLTEIKPDKGLEELDGFDEVIAMLVATIK